MFNISKTFECCYGHRVWNQSLNQKYSLDNACVCRHIHGHQMKLMVGLKAKNLENGMVTDFKHLNCIKKLVDDVIDHKFIMDINDPLFSNLFSEIRFPHNTIFNRDFTLVIINVCFTELFSNSWSLLYKIKSKMSVHITVMLYLN